ncbi:uncharacterized protein TNCV_1867491 [Trichonephila clavipes]|nr:uncharacterized protein TNCV_1867491 [Trichonephila clavipes]
MMTHLLDKKNPGRPPTEDNPAHLSERHCTSHIPPTPAKREPARHCKILRNQYPEQPPLAIITALVCLNIEPNKYWMTGTDAHEASTRCYSSGNTVTDKWGRASHSAIMDQTFFIGKKSEKIELREDLKSRRGLAVSLEIICHNCGESTSTMSSKISNKCYDVNLRLTYGMRAIGKGGAAARIFCGLMNLPPPPAKFERHNSLFLNVLKTISEDSMNAAVHEAVIANANNSNIAVAVDATWHKRGYSSLNGVVCATSVENGKVIDFEALTKYCSSCKEAKVYGDTEVEKLECVGHVQKRMGTRLRNILKMSKGIKLSDGENISGRGRLTLKEVDSIQHYYGLAIRKNLSSVEDMKRAIWAIYFHKLSTEDNPQHALCPLGEDSWCGYNRSIVTGEFSIHKHSLPESILLKVKKVFRDFTEKDLLKKCLHGRTQNPNESFNKCIWERIPKTVFVGIETLKFGVMDAAICFNDGYVSRIKVFEALGIKPGYNTERAVLIIDNKRIFEAERIVNKVSLEARNKRRFLKRKMDKQNLDEENEYQAGEY